LKQIQFRENELGDETFRLPFPRKGIETLFSNFKRHKNGSTFRLPFPRKGIETQFYNSICRQFDLSAYLFPTRGLKQRLSKLEPSVITSFRLPFPRKGIETFLADTSLVVISLFPFRLPFPRKGIETLH